MEKPFEVQSNREDTRQVESGGGEGGRGFLGVFVKVKVVSDLICFLYLSYKGSTKEKLFF